VNMDFTSAAGFRLGFLGEGLPMYAFMLIGAVFGFLVGAVLSSQAAIDAPSDVNPTVSSPASSDSEGYQFAAPPASSADFIYRVNQASGEVGACAFSAKGPTIGSTVCFPAGEGAGPQPTGEYRLVSSNLATANGIFRVNRQTGEMSVCYVLNERVVCTAPLR
jgi:hypothetical protein